MSRLVLRFGWVIAVLALVVALIGTVAVSAQDEPLTGIPEGATDGASISYMSENEDDPLAPVLTFAMFSFEDDEAAEEGFEDYVEQFETAMAETAAEESENGLVVELVEMGGDELDGLDELGDERMAWRIDYVGEDVAGFSFGILMVRDGETVQAWSRIIFDLSVLMGGEATAEPVGANDAINFLVGFATDWFDGGMPDDGDLIDRLPTIDDLPAGYAETERAEGLDEIEASAGE
jgi:hypothetical protein